MLLPTPSQNHEFEITPSGTFAARCYRFIDLGTQPKEWQGKTSYVRKVMMGWELPDEKMADDRPFSIFQSYTWSMSEKSLLRMHLESWRGVKFTDADFGVFDTKKLIGVPCMISVVHNTKGEKTYANISSISRVMKGLVVADAVNPTTYFTLEDFDQKVFDALSDNLKDKIRKSPEYMDLNNPEMPSIPEYDPSRELGESDYITNIPF